MSKRCWIGLLALLPVLFGCGGETVGEQFRPLGEGNIPIGRGQTNDTCESSVKIVMSDGRVSNTVTRQQVIYAPVLPKGPTLISITPQNYLYSTCTFTYSVGPDQYWAFNARPLPKAKSQTVQAFETNFPNGATFHVGDTFDVKCTVLNPSNAGVRLTLIVSGGVARIDEEDELTFTKAGAAKLIVTLGVTKLTYDFVVTE